MGTMLNAIALTKTHSFVYWTLNIDSNENDNSKLHIFLITYIFKKNINILESFLLILKKKAHPSRFPTALIRLNNRMKIEGLQRISCGGGGKNNCVYKRYNF